MKRWEPVSNGPDDTTWMEARASGQYVLHSDVLALLAVAEAAKEMDNSYGASNMTKFWVMWRKAQSALARLDGEVGNG